MFSCPPVLCASTLNLGLIKKLDLAAKNYDDIPLHGEVEVENLRIPIQCESHDGRTLEVTFEPPFRYLGVGRDKVVISGLVHGLDAVVGNSEPITAAIAIARKNFDAVGQLSGSLCGYRCLREHVPTASTYSWYLGSVDGQVVVMPDLTAQGSIITAQNDRILSHEKIARLEARFNDLEEQLRCFVDGLPFGVAVTFDTYFAILGKDSSHLFLGDFDSMSVECTSVDRGIYNRRQAENWMDCLARYTRDCSVSSDFQRWAHQHELPPSKK